MVDDKKRIPVRIKKGAMISHNLMICEWPECLDAGETGKDPQMLAKDPDMIFSGFLHYGRWHCKGPGFGNSDDFGFGGIFVLSHDGVEIVDDVAA